MLAELQRDFARAVRGDALVVQQLDIHAAGLNAERRLAIYRNHHRISLAGALAANFPTVAKVVGEQAFQTLAESFIALDPPREPSLAAYGAGFAAFLEEDARARRLSYLADVARLDWARNLAERADDLAVFGPQHLAALDEARLTSFTLAPHPSLTLLPSPFPLLRIRDLAAGATEDGVSLDQGGVHLMIWRADGAISCTDLEPPMFRFVVSLASGKLLAEAAEHLAPERLPEVLAVTVLSGAFLAPAL